MNVYVVIPRLVGSTVETLALMPEKMALMNELRREALSEKTALQDAGYSVIEAYEHIDEWVVNDVYVMQRDAAITEIDPQDAPAPLDEQPAWAAGATAQEQKAIMYEQRKATLGGKAAGRMTYGRVRRE